MIAEIVRTFGSQASRFLSALDGSAWSAGNPRAKFDLWAANKAILERSGVRSIEVAGICTVCHTEDWYSHRAERGQTGRFGAMIGLGK